MLGLSEAIKLRMLLSEEAHHISSNVLGLG